MLLLPQMDNFVAKFSSSGEGNYMTVNSDDTKITDL